MFFQAGKAQNPQELNWSSLGCQSDPEMSRFRKSNPSVAEIFAAPLWGVGENLQANLEAVRDSTGKGWAWEKCMTEIQPQ